MNDNTHLHWNAPRRRATQPMGTSEDDAHPMQRPSTATNYFGLDGSESSSTASGGAGVGGFAQVPARGSGGHSRSGSAASPAAAEVPVERDRRIKVNQIVQNFFWKAAMVIIQSRMPVVALISPRTQEKKTNKWACSSLLLFAASANAPSSTSSSTRWRRSAMS